MKAAIQITMLFVLLMAGCAKQAALSTYWEGIYYSPVKNDTIYRLQVYKNGDDRVQMQFQLADTNRSAYYPDTTYHFSNYAVFNNVQLESQTMASVDESTPLVAGSANYHIAGSAGLSLNQIFINTTYTNLNTLTVDSFVFTGTKQVFR